MTKKDRGASATTPGTLLTEAEIVEALGRSGYPFEVKLLLDLDRLGLDPSNGFRLKVADGPTRPLEGDDPDEASSLTRETDAMARVFVAKNLPQGEGQVPNLAPVAMGLLAVIEAKALPPTAAFVGFTYKPPSQLDRRAQRMSFAGAPCNGVLADHSVPDHVALQLAATLDPINSGPYCIQWALVERVEKGGSSELRANHPVRWAAALANLVRGLHLLARENSRHLLSAAGPVSARVDFQEPTLFIQTPHLYLFDVASEKLTTTKHLTIAQMFELFDGQQRLRLVDVWSNTGVEDFAARYKAVRENFEACIPSLGIELVRASMSQKQAIRDERAAEVWAATLQTPAS